MASFTSKSASNSNFKWAVNVDTDRLVGLAGPSILHGVAMALYIEAEKIMTASKLDFVPYVTGNLARSGTVLPPFMGSGQMGAGKVRVVLAYGNHTAPYALAVHERPPTVGQGKNKYLEKPFEAARPMVMRNLAARLRTIINSVAAGQQIPAEAWRAFRQDYGGE